MSRPPLMSIVIVNYNGLRHLRECLDSIHAQDFRDFEVVFVDNASSDGSIEFMRANFPQAVLVRSEANLGFAGGNNLGFKHSRGELVFLLNNDTRLAPDALRKLAEAAAERPDVGVFSAFLINYADESLSDSGGDTVYTNGFVAALGGYPVEIFNRRRLIASACGAAAMFRMPLLRKTGGFDEDFFLNFEDLDLSFRCRHLGESILFLPEARVYHKGSASLGGKTSRLSVYYSERNQAWFLVKNFPAVFLARALPFLLLSKTLRLWQSARRGQLGAYFSANIHGIAGLPRMLAKRRAILSASKLSSREFGSLLRPGWLRERLAYRRGNRRLEP